MDLATLIGMIGAFAMVVMAMMIGGGFGMFIDTPSILIVLVGSHFVVLSKNLIKCIVSCNDLKWAPFSNIVEHFFTDVTDHITIIVNIDDGSNNLCFVLVDMRMYLGELLVIG